MDSSASDIENLIGNEFFDALERQLKLHIPEVLRNILIFHDVDYPSIISRLDESYIDKLEDFMKSKFNQDMVADGKTLSDYFGKFHKNKLQFQFSIGQRIAFTIIREFCVKLFSKINTTESERNVRTIMDYFVT